MMIDPRVAIREDIAARIFVITAHRIGKIDSIARTAEVCIADGDHADETVRGRITSADTEISRTLLVNNDFHDDAVRLNARVHLEVDIVEKTEVVDALNAALCKLRVERRAGLLAHLAQDNLITRLFIAFDRISLQNTLIDLEEEIAFIIDIHIRDFRKDITVLFVLILKSCHILVKDAVVKNRTRANCHKAVECIV